MKHYIIYILLVIGKTSFAQKIDVEVRNGNQVVIVARDTTQIGEPVEVATWKAQPRKFLMQELEKSTQMAEATAGQIQQLQTILAQQKELIKDLTRAIKKLDAGIIIETKTLPDPTQPPAKKPTKKGKKAAKNTKKE